MNNCQLWSLVPATKCPSLLKSIRVDAILYDLYPGGTRVCGKGEQGRLAGVERDWGLYRAPLPGDLLFTKQLQEPGFADPVVPLQQLQLQAILLSQSLNENEFDRYANELLP